MSRWRLVALWLALAALSVEARADTAAQEARRLFERAEVHFSVGEFVEALELYKQAYKTKPLPGFLFNIGQCQRKLGRCEQAVFSFRQYLQHFPEAPNRETALELIQECEALLKSKPAQHPPPPATAATAASAPVRSVTEPRPALGRKRIHRGWFWGSAGLAAALFVTGAVTGGIALSKSNEYKNSGTPIDLRGDLKNSGERLADVSTGTLIAGGAVAATTVVLALFTRWRSDKRTRVTVTPWGVRVGGEF